MLVICFEITIVVLVMWLLITQVSIPVYRGSKLFPIFRKEEKLKSQLSEIKQEKIEKDLELKIKKEKEETNRKSSTPKMSSIFSDSNDS